MGVPTRLGRYAVRRRLGSGGFATVWLAHDEQLDAEVAIKVLADNWAHDDAVRGRFLEEGRFLRRVESEHVVQVHDVGELEDGRPFLVLTYADRGTLADRLKKAPLPLAEAVDVVVQVGRGLQALHRRGLLHRDVKPANVLFRSSDEGERAVLSDLGLGKSIDEVSRITMPGGTPSYVAPEQALGERLDERADQYSLGAVAYAALTGRSPHQVDGLGAASRVKAAPPPSSLGFELPDLVDAAIVRALDPDREQRWPDVQSFTRELVGALDETTHDFPLSLRATIVVPPAPEEGEKTALSDENQPTIVKAAAPGTDATTADSAAVAALSEAVAGAAESLAQEETADVQPPTPRKRRRGRWVIAAVLALIVGGGAGFEGQRYVAGRELVPVEYGGISLTLPRGWTNSVADSEWQPPGSAKSYPALRVSQNANWSTDTPGVFVGVTDARDVKLALVSSPQFSCNTLGNPAPSTVEGQTVTDQVSNGCGDGGAMLFQRVVDTGTTGSMLIQVLLPKNDPDRAREIASSVHYNGG
ncbi:protein kinase [Kribbella sp. NPDC026596]|uniref:protein kinase domain-containing protein n=1 Tax=Kribbella sp. NPDC026596 TaxID=3155122 RepID=UPI0033C833E7